MRSGGQCRDTVTWALGHAMGWHHGHKNPSQKLAMGFLAFWKWGTTSPVLPAPPQQRAGEGSSCQCLSAVSDKSARLKPHDLYSLIQHWAGSTRARPGRGAGLSPGGHGSRGTVPPRREGTEVMKFVNGECLQGSSGGNQWGAGSHCGQCRQRRQWGSAGSGAVGQRRQWGSAGSGAAGQRRQRGSGAAGQRRQRSCTLGTSTTSQHLPATPAQQPSPSHIPPTMQPERRASR